MTHSVSLKCAATGDCFSERNLWSGSSNAKTLSSDLPLESHLTSNFNICAAEASTPSHFFVGEKTCVFCVHLLTELGEQECVKGMYFNVVDSFDHIL